MTYQKNQRPADDGERLGCGDIAAAGETIYDDGWETWCVSCQTRWDDADARVNSLVGTGTTLVVRPKANQTAAAAVVVRETVDAALLRPAVAEVVVSMALRALTSGTPVRGDRYADVVARRALAAARDAIAETAGR